MSVPSWTAASLPSRSSFKGLRLSVDSADSVASYELVGNDEAGTQLGRQRKRCPTPLHGLCANIAAAAKATPALSCIVIVVLLAAVTCMAVTLLLTQTRDRSALSRLHQLPAISEAQRNASVTRHAPHEQCLEIYPGLYE